MCNDCVDAMFDQYVQELGGEKEAMKRMCMKLDLYWSEEIFSMMEKTVGNGSRVRNYIGKTNIARFLDKSYDDTVREEAAQQAVYKAWYGPFNSQEGQEEKVEPEEPEEPVEQSVIDFWGTGYPNDMYAELERHYKDWTGGVEITEPNVRSLYRQICLLEVMISRDSAQGKPIDKNVNVLNSLLGSLNLKPSQKKDDGDTELDKMPLGVGIQKWENSRPLPETPKNKRDVRGTIKNITTWYLGHLCKMVGIKNSYCKLYEDAMEELRVKHPEYEDEDDDTFLNDVVTSPGDASGSSGGDNSG